MSTELRRTATIARTGAARSRYFAYDEAYRLLRLEVRPRLAIIRRTGPCAALIVTDASCGRVTQLATGPYADTYLVGVRWAEPRPVRTVAVPIDWYNREDFSRLLESSDSVEAA